MKKLLSSTAVVTALMMTASSAFGAGFAIREQSVSSQGASFAGSAAGHDLSSMFWNPAAAAVKSGPGIHTESHYSAIFSHAQVTVEESSVIGFPAAGDNVLGPFGSNNSGDIAPAALVGASYASYQLSEKLYLGFSLNSPFGLSTQPRDQNYQGALLGRTTSLLTFNAAPTLAYKVAPGVTIGAGVQVQYGDGTFKFATGLPSLPSTGFEGKGWAFGGTAGILLQPSSSTSIGLGYRSRLKQNLDGEFFTNSGVGFIPRPLIVDAQVDLELPDIVTLSIRQAVSPSMRIMATVEWSNWSRFEDLTVESEATAITALGPTTPGATIASIPANWSDGWFFSGGAEYDVYDYMTIRGGVAYEISPVDSAEKRLVGIPDNDRIWLSLGATVDVTEATKMDFGYTHIFIKDGDFDRDSLGGVNLKGEVEASTNIFSVSLKTKM